MLPLQTVLFESDYMSATTNFMHLLVLDVAALSMYVLELLSVLIIVYTTVRAFIKLFKHKPYAKIYLLHGQSIGLSFKLGAEILRTVTARSLDELWEILLLIVIKACMVLLIEWELKGTEDPTTSDGFAKLEDTPVSHPKTPIYYKGTHIHTESSDLSGFSEDISRLKSILHPQEEKKQADTNDPS